VVEPQEGADRGLEIRRARGAQQDRVGIGGQTLRLRQADRVGCRHRDWPRESRTTVRPGTKGRAFRGATLIRRCRTLLTDGPAACATTDRRCPVSLALCAGAYWRLRQDAASRSVRRLPGPFPVVVAPARTNRRISGSTHDRY